MRRGQGRTAAMVLMLIIAVLLGFWGGYKLLPHTGLARAFGYNEGLLIGSLPYGTALAAEPPEIEPAQHLLLQASLSATAALVEQPGLAAEEEHGVMAARAQGENSVVESEAGTPALPDKAEPRLIMIAEDSVAAFAALNVAQAEAAQAAAVQAAKAPRIAVYCTHSSEEYSGQARIPGARGGVHEVAQQLSESLNALGLATIYCDTVHDYPDWDLSYANSLASIQKLQKQNPSLEVFIDVHRDSQANSVLPTASGNVARIMLVVGSDARLEHPHWQRNKAFSEQIHQKLEQVLPGITRSVNVQQGRYNQQISDKAILVEMGSTVNTVTEAKASAKLLAEALASLL